MLATLRKAGGGHSVGLNDTLELLFKTLVPTDTEGESEEHKRLHEETGVQLGDTVERPGSQM